MQTRGSLRRAVATIQVWRHSKCGWPSFIGDCYARICTNTWFRTPAAPTFRVRISGETTLDLATWSTETLVDGHRANDPLRISHIGTSALLLEAPGDLTMDVQQLILALADAVAEWPEFSEAVPGVTNLMLVFGEARCADITSLSRRLQALWAHIPPKRLSSKVVEIATTYGGPLAEDLDAVARHAGLTPREVIDIHAAGRYTVLTVASSPGFAYLHGLDPRIHCPRKTTPSLKMLKGSVTIGGMQTGVAVSTGPNGWNAIGHAEIDMFDPASDPPVLLRPGDRVRFVPERILL